MFQEKAGRSFALTGECLAKVARSSAQTLGRATFIGDDRTRAATWAARLAFADVNDVLLQSLLNCRTECSGCTPRP